MGSVQPERFKPRLVTLVKSAHVPKSDVTQCVYVGFLGKALLRENEVVVGPIETAETARIPNSAVSSSTRLLTLTSRYTYLLLLWDHRLPALIAHISYPDACNRPFLLPTF